MAEQKIEINTNTNTTQINETIRYLRIYRSDYILDIELRFEGKKLEGFRIDFYYRKDKKNVKDLTIIAPKGRDIEVLYKVGNPYDKPHYISTIRADRSYLDEFNKDVQNDKRFEEINQTVDDKLVLEYTKYLIGWLFDGPCAMLLDIIPLLDETISEEIHRIEKEKRKDS